MLHLVLLDLEPSFSEFLFLRSVCKLGDPVKWSFPEPAQEPVAS